MTPEPTLPRIVHVASGREWRGGERQVLVLARHLTKLGVDQLVVTSKNGKLATELAGGGIPTRLVDWWAGLSPTAFAAILAEATGTASILHAHDAHALTLVGAAAKVARCPFVVTRRLDLPLRRPGFWARADQIIAVSQSVQRVLLRDGIEPNRIVVIHSGIDLEPFPASAPSEVRRAVGLPAEGPIALSVAALVPTKGQEVVIRAAAALRASHPELHWVLAGEGTDRGRLEQLARDLGVGPVIHLVGELPDPRPLIAAAALMVHCPVHEALGTSLLDAMALGIPIVACSVGGISELLGEGAGVLVQGREPATVARAVSGLLGDEKLRRDVTNKARSVVSRFSAEGMATRVLEVYRSVALDR